MRIDIGLTNEKVLRLDLEIEGRVFVSYREITTIYFCSKESGRDRLYVIDDRCTLINVNLIIFNFSVVGVGGVKLTIHRCTLITDGKTCRVYYFVKVVTLFKIT